MTATRRCAIVVAAAVAGAALAPVSAATPRKRPRTFIVSIMASTELQGTAGAGANVVVPFTVAATVGRRADVQMEYALDDDGDGIFSEGEFRSATEDRLDPRNTRSLAPPQLYPASRLPGTPNHFVWRSLDDLGIGQFWTVEYALTPQGRQIPDPDNPGAFLFATGPGHTSGTSGVIVRMRTVWRRTKRGRLFSSPWVPSGEFAVENAATPSMTIDTAESGAPVMVGWTAYDADSEDVNGNGIFDVTLSEDVNHNGSFDCEKMGVAFDFHRLAAAEDPAAMSDVQLAALAWSPCTRVANVGDTDSLDARPGVPVPQTGDLSGVCSAPPGVGRQWHFAWDAARDVGVTTDGFILRGTPFCEHRKRGATVYSRIVVHE